MFDGNQEDYDLWCPSRSVVKCYHCREWRRRGAMGKLFKRYARVLRFCGDYELPADLGEGIPQGGVGDL